MDDLHRAVERISEEVDELESLARLPGLDLLPFFTVKRDYRAFWQKAREVSALFKELRLPQKERAELWYRYGALCEAVKDLQTRERQEKQNESARNRSEIESYLREARLWAGGAENMGHLSEAKTRLTKAMEILKEKLLLKEDRDPCWESWKEISDQVRDRQYQLRAYRYDAISREIEAVSSVAVYGDPHEAVRKMQAIQSTLKAADLSRDQRSSLRDALQHWWNEATRRMDERREAGKRKRQEWEGHMEEKLGRLENLKDKNSRIVSQLRSQIDDLEAKIASSGNSAWAQRARGWILEKYEKISDIRRTNGELEEKMEDIRRRLRGD